VYLGLQSGRLNQTGTGNVFLGHQAGYNESGSNRLYIDNSNTSKPLLYGEFNTNRLYMHGQIAMGGPGATRKWADGYLLSVMGKIMTEEVRVRLNANWPDYVFKNDYALTPIDQLEAQIKTLGHLPGIPAAAEVESEGFDLGEMNRLQMEKIEELTLYIIELEKRTKAAEAKNESFEKRLSALEK
jgi:hypothetical protein